MVGAHGLRSPMARLQLAHSRLQCCTLGRDSGCSSKEIVCFTQQARKRAPACPRQCENMTIETIKRLRGARCRTTAPALSHGKAHSITLGEIAQRTDVQDMRCGRLRAAGAPVANINRSGAAACITAQPAGQP
jgi:hypothetical protein